MKGIAEYSLDRKVHILSLVLLISYGNAYMQADVCMIQSYFREKQGTGSEGPGNLLIAKRVRYHLNRTVTPSGLTFTGSCNDSRNKREFLMVKRNIRRLLTVTFHWNANKDYVLAIKDKNLQLEHKKKLDQRDYLFIRQCATIDCKRQSTLKKVMSPFYVKTGNNGIPMVGQHPRDTATWFKILGEDICDTG